MRPMRLFYMATIAALVWAGAASAQQTTRSTEVRNFTVVSVDGNKLVVNEQGVGAREYTVPADFRFNVEGKQVGVADLKPGMKGTATFTTITTVKPVHVTEVKNGEVIQKSGNSIIVRTADGIKMFSEGDIEKRGITIMKDGQKAELSDLHTGDRLSATIVTEGTPKVMTERQVQATITGQGAAAGSQPRASGSSASSASGSTGTSASRTTTGGSTASTTRHLPKTASYRPLVGASGLLLLGAALLTTALRRRATLR